VRQRQPRIEDAAHLAYVRGLPCTICGMPGSDPAHLRSAAPEYGKRHTGMQEKPDDCWVLPLCRRHHDEQHGTNELLWWASYGIADPFALAADLYASRPGASKPRQQSAKRERPVPPRKPKEQRANVGNGQSRKLESRPNWPPKGSRKIPTRKDHADA
jgi:hypothetical protein